MPTNTPPVERNRFQTLVSVKLADYFTLRITSAQLAQQDKGGGSDGLPVVLPVDTIRFVLEDRNSGAHGHWMCVNLLFYSLN